MAEHYLREYGVATVVEFELFEVDGIDLRVDAAHASGDTKISIDQGAEGNTAAGFTDRGQGYSQPFTAAEMTGKMMRIPVVDSAAKVWLDHTLVVETYGHPDAQHPGDPKILLATTIDAYTSNTDFTLIAGSGDNNAYGPAMMLIEDQSTATQKAVTILGTYTGSTKRAQPINDPGTFTYAGGDRVTLIAITPALPAALADAAAGLSISDAGGLDLDTKLANTNEVTAARMATLTDWINGGRLDLLLDAIKVVTDKFTFAAGNAVDANVARINNTALVGDGDATKWGPA